TGGGPVYPGYLWEFPCEAGSCDGWRPYMGETWSQPVITRVKATLDCGNESTWSSCGTVDRWVAIFGGGYDASGDPNMPHDVDATVVAGEYDPGTDADTLLAGRALFMVDIATGQVLAAKRFQYDGTAGDPADGEPGMQYAIASAPAVFDLDFDGYADAVYVGDLGGNVWKWLISPPAEDHLRGSSGDDHQGRWEFLKILAAENCTSCSPAHYKSFFYPPTGAVLGQNLWLALGSGERANLDYGQDGVSDDAAKNRYYVFKDRDPFELERVAATELPYTDVSPSTDFVDGTSITDFNPSSCLGSNAVGFYFEGEAGEKFITESVIFFGVVLTGSYVPASSAASVCVAAGQAYLYGFHLLCGEGVFPPESEGDPKQCRIEIGGGSGGLPNAPRVSVGPVDDDGGGDDCTDMVVVITSEGSGFEDCLTERPGSGLRVKSWRDL
ncbi:MAG: hypothetical protein JRS35_17195, partial [Deltaproteobacteria bacterium]|nr:hypothetical protein [Deltaproteobacteria bacterium]